MCPTMRFKVTDPYFIFLKRLNPLLLETILVGHPFPGQGLREINFMIPFIASSFYKWL
jgi:hypothetical protein